MNKTVSVILIGLLFFIISISVHSIENYTVTFVVLILLALLGSLGAWFFRNYFGNRHWIIPLPIVILYPGVYFLLQYTVKESPSAYCFVVAGLHGFSYVLFWYILKTGKTLWRTVTFLLLTLTALIATAYYFLSLYVAHAYQREIYIELPNFSLLSTRGDTLQSKELFDNKVVVIDFWTIHCKPCREALPMLQELHRSYASNPSVAIYSVNTGREDSMREMKVYLKDVEAEISEDRVLYDLDSRMTGYLDIVSLPRYCIIGKDGAVHFENEGYIKTNSILYKQWFQERIDLLLRK